MPDAETLTALYPKTYYAYQEFGAKHGFITSLKQCIKTVCMMHIGTKDPSFERPGRVLDIGCGSGKFLYKMRQQGWETYGVEVSDQAAQVGQRVGLNIYCGTLLDAHFESDFFDYVRANHSLEHIVNPQETLAEVHRILKPQGKLHIGVPNIDSWNARLFKEYWWYLGVPIHPYSYSVRTLSHMLQKNGFVVERVLFNSDYSGILGSLQIALNRNSQRLSTEGWVFNSYILRIFAQRIAKLFDLFRKGDAIEITACKEKSAS